MRRTCADAKKKSPAKAGQKAHVLPAARVKRMIVKYRSSPLPAQFISRLKNALPDLLAFVSATRIPFTDNAAGRGLREIVVHRKMRGPPRAEDGANHGQHLCVSYDMKAARTGSPSRDGKTHPNGARSRE